MDSFVIEPPTAKEWANHWRHLIRAQQQGGAETENSEDATFIVTAHGTGKTSGRGIGRHAASPMSYFSFVRNPKKKKEEPVPQVEIVSPSEQVLQQAKALPDKKDVDITINSEEFERRYQTKTRRRGGKTVSKNKKKKKKN